jgi:phosphoribosylformylglycinamidine synthase
MEPPPHKEFPYKIRPDAMLFSESPSRVLITVREAKLYKLQALLDEQDSVYSILGKTGGASLTIQVGDKISVDLSIKEMENAYQTGFRKHFESA